MTCFSLNQLASSKVSPRKAGMLSIFKASVSLILILPLLENHVRANSDTKYTREEKAALSKFRGMMKSSLYRDYMKSDWYLINWLRAKELDLQKAKEMLQNSINSRKESQIDNLSKDRIMQVWMQKKFPAELDGVDKQGRPLLTVSAGKWDIRKAMVGGQRDALARYLDFLYESCGARIRQTRNTTGADVTQNLLILDMNNYNLKQHGCAACLPFFHDLITRYEYHHPAQCSHLILINTPQFFQSVLEFIRPLMSPATKRDMKIFRHDKTEWSSFILNLVPANQLTPQYGGTKGIKKI